VSLQDCGWNEWFAQALARLERRGLEPARVLQSGMGSLRLITAGGERRASVAGRLRREADGTDAAPAVGDWVAVTPVEPAAARIEHVLPRRSKLSRKVAGKRSLEQVVAANVDTVFAVAGLDGDFSVRRVERLLTMVWQSGARPVVLLNKLDLCPEAEARRDQVVQVAPGVPVLLLSCLAETGIEAVSDLIPPRETAVLVGSSGVGKSTLINRLLGTTAQRTRDVREGDDRGRHTTTHRELFRLPGGGMLIDNPGIREVQLWSDEQALSRAFDDIAELEPDCRFRDCRHETETGCAVLAAVESGALPAARLASYRELQKELRYLELRRNDQYQRAEKQKWRTIHKETRRTYKAKKR
jgi:ribosome biogenesis GTPase